MPTKYDVFAEVIKKAPCKPRELSFDASIYAHLNSLIKNNWIKKTDEGILKPVSNRETKSVKKIIEYSLKNNFNLNIWFSGNFLNILNILSEMQPNLNPKELSGNSRNSKIINFLVENQFILVYQKRPKKGTLLRNKVFDYLFESIGGRLDFNERFLRYDEIGELVLKTKRVEVNPFGVEIFEFLAGSAQLEGSTVSAGETMDILMKDIYPDKPQQDIQMVKNLNVAFSYILERIEDDLTLEDVRELNKLCLFSLHKGGGKFKKVHNKIQGNSDFKTAYPKDVVPKLMGFCEVFNSIGSREDVVKNLGYIHNEFQHIHPFSDGNSRVTRLIVNWLLMKFSLPILVLKQGSFDEYMSLTKLSKKRRDDELGKFLLHLIYHECRV